MPPSGSFVEKPPYDAGPKKPVPNYVDQMPRFPGNLNDWLHANLRYPPAAKAAGAKGRVLLSFFVEADGRITNAVIPKKVRPDFDTEALRLVNAMPAWIPARKNGRAVRISLGIPVVFKLK